MLRQESELRRKKILINWKSDNVTDSYKQNYPP